MRAHFLARAAAELAYAGVMLARADLCELLAMKLLAPFAADGSESAADVDREGEGGAEPAVGSGRLAVTAVLATSWSPLAGAPPGVLRSVRAALGGGSGAAPAFVPRTPTPGEYRNGAQHSGEAAAGEGWDVDELAEPQSALEMAIATRAKAFLSAPLVQGVVHDIYAGRVVFQMAAHRSVLADNYKPRAIAVYDSRTAPFLDHYRCVRGASRLVCGELLKREV